MIDALLRVNPRLAKVKAADIIDNSFVDRLEKSGYIAEAMKRGRSRLVWQKSEVHHEGRKGRNRTGINSPRKEFASARTRDLLLNLRAFVPSW